MIPFNNWAVALNGVVITTDCNPNTVDTDEDIAQNLIVDPSFEGDLVLGPHWAASNAAESTATVVDTESYAGENSVQIEATATSSDPMGIELDPLDPDGNFIVAIEGDHLWGSGLFLTADAVSSDVEVAISFYDVDDVLISTITATGTALAGVWKRVSVDGLAPADTAKAQLHLNFVDGGAMGDILGWVDAAMVTISDALVDWFDGDTQDTTFYQHVWDGTENDSISTRTPCYLLFGSTILEGLVDTPDGLGWSGMRVEDVTYPQKDGVRHFNDWYRERVITLTVSLGPNMEECGNCLTVREQFMLLQQAWKRQPNDVELVLYPPCEAGNDMEQRVLTGPYAIRGRPRGFDYKWAPRNEQIVDVTMQFYAENQKAYVLDPCGTPESYESHIIPPGVAQSCVQVPFCLTTGGALCLDQQVGDDVEPTVITIAGTECVSPIIILYPGLTSPRVENLNTGEYIGYAGSIVDYPVVIYTEDGSAFQNGESVTHNLRGSLTFKMDPGEYEMRLVTTSDGDDGYAEFTYRPTVLMV